MTIDNRQYFALVEQQLADGQRVKIPLRGTSMESTLREGDVLTLGPLSRPLRVGDVVLFRYRGDYRLHRLLSVEGDRCVMRGDNCFTTEEAAASDVVALLLGVDRPRNGLHMEVGDARWLRATRRAERRRRCRQRAAGVAGRAARKRLRPWYFALLAFLMWAPLNGVGIPLDNYILGLRADHLLHASVYLPCALLLCDLFPRRRWLAWLAAIGIGLLTEGVQYLLPWRGFDVNDLVANALGSTLGWLMVILVRHRATR